MRTTLYLVETSSPFLSQKKKACNDDKTCMWRRRQCMLNRDVASKVCCQGEVHEYCEDVANGKCPKDFQAGTNDQG